MKLSKELSDFSARLGHNFANTELLIQAMTHSSLSSSTRKDNQRLEFLGDRVLGLTISHALFGYDEDADEGLLAPRFNSLVRKETCADVAQEIRLGDALKLGRSEMLSGGRRKMAILGDGMEAVIAAVYLDAGFEVVQALILRLWGDRIKNADIDARDAKTSLQEWAQARRLPPPVYTEIGRDGPDHAPVFEIEVTLKTGEKASAKAPSKRAASQDAAGKLLEQVEAKT